jgi:hypothetical protein
MYFKFVISNSQFKKSCFIPKNMGLIKVCNYDKQFLVSHSFIQRYVRFWPCDLFLLQFMNTITEICATVLPKNMMLLSPIFFLRYDDSGNIVRHD